jgi:hypothetical protein
MATQTVALMANSMGSDGFISTTGPDGTGGISPTGGPGLAATTAGGGPTVFHGGGVSAAAVIFGTDTGPSVTETYITEVYVPCTAILTGIAILNGSGTAGNVTVGLADNTGTPILAAVSASTAQSGSNYQLVPFATPYQASGPERYFIQAQFSTSTTAKFRAHVVGTFNAQKQTTQTYGTLTAFTPANTFTTNVGPVCSTY